MKYLSPSLFAMVLFNVGLLGCSSKTEPSTTEQTQQDDDDSNNEGGKNNTEHSAGSGGIGGSSSEDADGDGYTYEDCNDSNPDIHPGAQEIADGLDQDCDGIVDEGTSAHDDDGDGYTEVAGDCNDQDLSIHPGANELANSLDDDCDGEIDEGTSNEDGDGDGFSPTQGDCDDDDPLRHPGADDIADDSMDQDCGGTNGPEPHVGFDGETTTIQQAIDALDESVEVISGKTLTIWVNQGTYLEHDLDTKGKSFRLKSTHGSAKTIIDAESKSLVMQIVSGEDQTTIVDGFTLTKGVATDETAGGITVVNSSPTLTHLDIVGNYSTGSDGRPAGIYLNNASPTMTYLNISTNEASQGCAGLAMDNSSPQIQNMTISSNVRHTPTSMWAAIAMIINGGNPRMTNVLISDHPSCDLNYYCDLIILMQTNAIFDNILIANNSSKSTFYIYNSSPTFTNSMMVHNDALEVSTLIIADSNSTSEPIFTNSVFAYNSGTDIFIDDNSPDTTNPTFDYCSIYNPDGNTYVPVGFDPGLTTLYIEPQFFKYMNASGQECSSGLAGCEPVDFHLDPLSPLVEYGMDESNAATDVGIYGGENGAKWDRDFDGCPDYFWPGSYDDAPEGINNSNYDPDDQNFTKKGQACP